MSPTRFLLVSVDCPEPFYVRLQIELQLLIAGHLHYLLTVYADRAYCTRTTLASIYWDSIQQLSAGTSDGALTLGLEKETLNENTVMTLLIDLNTSSFYFDPDLTLSGYQSEFS